MISHFNRFLCKEIEMADRVRFMRIKKAGESGDSEVGEKCFAVCAVRMRLVPFDVVLVSKDGLGVLAMNVTRATVGSCVGLPVRSRIADKAWARGMRRETRDARRETRDARRETRDARRETRDARRETRDARRETRDARRETRDARRETRDARRETRDARRETRDARRETRDARRVRGIGSVGRGRKCSGFVPKRPERFMRINSRLSRSACACLCGSTLLVGPWAREGRAAT
ncbi:hypothetical protein BgramDRAFT_0899 [Paraburkholderia graminis C4D1M]|uniref:Uncharacterized protein n=1 Tax=Paraburkholderia graminis (strain ATCC 700544 / DSM 17151 / LMG 18924 / NCIMB 13744 / C4D1M) TaxID=396598 RepID=B1FUM5_PARG4|nr:hypothetical protein BgramDRAFT_0899 [Paraburkholderia graminis C4D1M]